MKKKKDVMKFHLETVDVETGKCICEFSLDICQIVRRRENGRKRNAQRKKKANEAMIICCASTKLSRLERYSERKRENFYYLISISVNIDVKLQFVFAQTIYLRRS